MTDRHRQIAKWIRENWDVAHFFDCWHIVKSKQMFTYSMFKPDFQSLYSHGILCMTKKLEALSKKKNLVLIKEWIQSLKCHLYWCAFSSKNGEEIKRKWLACVEYIQDVHNNCTHAPIVNNKKWLMPGDSSSHTIQADNSRNCILI